MKKAFQRSALFVILLACSLIPLGCTFFQKAPPEKPVTAEKLVRLQENQYPAFSDGLYFDNLDHGISKSLEYLRRVPPEREFEFEKDRYNAGHLIRSLERLRKFFKTDPTEKELNRFIKANCIVYRSVGGKESGKMLFTGYFEPILRGSLKPDDTFQYPVYSMPKDLIRVNLSLFSKSLKGKYITARYNGKTIVPYHDRKAIENHKQFDLLAKPICWLDNPIDLFFLQIQGSGRVYLNSGGSILVHYHGSNGRPYRSIGRLLIDQGKIAKAEMSMQKIREYLTAHPEEMEDIFNYNPSYVFFKTEKSGPLGAIGVDLTPGRSIAVDRRVFPMATLSYVETSIPVIDGDSNIDRWIDFRAFTVNQDTGGAIRGPGRADIFWGSGPYAEIAAGHLQHKGELYLIVLKPER